MILLSYMNSILFLGYFDPTNTIFQKNSNYFSGWHNRYMGWRKNAGYHVSWSTNNDLETIKHLLAYQTRITVFQVIAEKCAPSE